ncbi:tetratricopeptide repeat protein [Solimonas sp. SE-A11]|uniref:tetratricopeptide repeat protein n=1 Tax=Solimonas sp. SE-A11 TaxID=3054954 RepID=UPI00259C9D43|nr:tetratricopeptide repeat protein [Solimonas sp. SE-A11]MDM4772563.1 tetratricopeptide repeat protein [Solimonas sp. SE-A11]
MTTQLKKLLLAFVAASVVSLSGFAIAKEKKEKPVPPPTKQTQVIRAETYKGMEVAQKAYEAKDYAGAVVALDALKAKEAKFNDYERATLYNLYAAVYYAQDNVPKAIEAYITVLKQPNLNDALRDGSLYALAQLYFISEQYPKAIAVVKKWLAASASPSPEGYALLAQANYQIQKFAEAEQALVQSLRISKERGVAPKESALSLLRAIYYERKEYAKAAKVLEILVTQYPGKAAYWQQLAGMRGLLDQQREQTTLMHAAYRGKLLTSESDLLNLARLYMVQDAPYAAVRLLTQGMRDKTIKPSTQNLELYAQALAMSREYEKQVPVLKKLAELSGESKHYVYLGQAYNELGQWSDAVTAFRSSLKAKNMDKTADVQMQLGTALFNANRYAEARQSFVAAQQSPTLAPQAGQWVKFVDQEIERRQAVGAE